MQKEVLRLEGATEIEGERSVLCVDRGREGRRRGQCVPVLLCVLLEPRFNGGGCAVRGRHLQFRQCRLDSQRPQAHDSGT